jgi:hypothetical protein
MTAQQLAIFADPAARRDDPRTAHEAAASVPTGALENQILEQFAIHGGLSDEDLCERLSHMYGPTVRTCRSRLVRRGLVVPTDARRPSARGRDLIVWRLS